MKYSLIINIMICFFLFTISSGCERAEIQKTTSIDKSKIALRDDDCECPNMGDCCCSVTFLSGDESHLSICGTTDGDAIACSVEDLCNGTIDGFEHSSFVLNDDDDLEELFCMAQNSGFQIANLDDKPITVVLTCQHGLISPQNVTISYTTRGKRFYSVNGECELTECP